MNILTPVTVTDSMLLGGTNIPEPAAGETAWVASGTYALGELRIRSTTHRVYACVLAHSGVTTPPESDPTRWLEKGPTQRYAPFDIYSSTKTTSTSTITYELQPGFVNALALYGLKGSSVTVNVKDTPGGTTIFSETRSVFEEPVGWYEYLFAPAKPKDRMIFTGIPIRPLAVVTVTVTGADNALGMLVVGDYVALTGDGAFGGTQYGASAEPITFSYIKTEDDGTTKIVRRNAATSLRARVVLPAGETDQALRRIRDVLDVPVAWVAADAVNYDGLNVFGLGSATVSYESPTHSQIDITVKGMI